ncbi:MAG TPA: hypothetical protein GXX70_00320 [Tepidimicrobium sp.]|nr:hypothetical protein [Tepidimicrobium sp.]
MKTHDGICYIDKEIEYRKYLKECCMRFGYTLDSLRCILYLLKMIDSQTENLDGLINRIKHLYHITLQSKDIKERMTLSTFHSAKGLEFENVYIRDLIEGDFLYANSISSFSKGKI